jgi:predicted nucleic acid-binding protein
MQEMLTEKGRHRGAGPIDLLVAATAELTGRTLLHYDREIETIAGTTGQAAQWLAPPGSID